MSFKRRAGHFFRAYKSILLALAITAAVGTIGIVFFHQATDLSKRNAAGQIAAIWKRDFGKEAERIAREVDALSRSDLVRFYLKRGDIAGVLAYSFEESRQRNLPGILIMDAKGQVLSRVRAASKRGDYVSQTTAWGRVVAAGDKIASFESGVSVPLLFIVGEPIVENGEQLGGVFAGHTLNDDYAREVRRAYFSAGSEIAFVAHDQGVVGSSFEDNETRSLIESHLAAEAHIDGNGQPTATSITLNDAYYLVSSIPLMGVNGEAGRMFVFTPDPIHAKSALFAVLLALSFIFVEAFVHQRLVRVPRRKEHFTLLIALAILLGGTIFFLAIDEFERDALRIAKPAFSIYNSTMALVPDANMLGQGIEQRITLQVITGGEAINAARTTLRYDPRKVEVLEIATETSFCNKELFLERSIDAASGRVEIACVLPAPGWSGSGSLADLIIRPLTPGNFTLTFEDASVLANDGLGTNVLREARAGSYQVIPFAFSPKQNGPLPLYSPTHPNSTRWYQKRDIDFIWPEGSGDRFDYALSERSLLAPKQAGETDRNALRITAAHDGAYVFTIASRNDKAVRATYEVHIDATPPQQTTIKASNANPKRGDLVRFEFSAEDTASGIQSYYVKIDDGIYLPVGKKLSMPFAETGRHTVTLRVYDRANNWSETSASIRVR